MARSDRIIAFIERLKIPSGIGQGEPFRLREWQKELIRKTYDPVHPDGRRKIRRALWSMARKNAKTGLAAALVLVHLIGPEAKRNGEVYSCASDRIQAAVIFKMAAQMVELDPDLSKMIKVIETQKRLVVWHLGSFYQALAADVRRLHGFNPVFVVYDELAQAKTRDLYDVMATSFGAQPEGLLLAISTQSADPNHIMSELADDAFKQMAGDNSDDTFFGHVFALPDGADPYDEKNWPLANPALGDFKDIGHMQSLAAKARRSPSAEAAFKALELNMRVNSVESLVTAADWRACKAEINEETLKNRPLYAGLDLSARQDLTAFVRVWDMGGGHVAVKSHFWTPEDKLKERGNQDGAPYELWRERGILTVLPGRSVDYGAVCRQIHAMTAGHDWKSLSYDKWRIDDLRREATHAGIDPGTWPLMEFAQTFMAFTPAIEALEDAVIQHKLQHDGNAALTYCMSNIKVIQDSNGNRKFDKRRRNRRIDGAVALAMAMHSIPRAEEPEKEEPFVYNFRGIRRV